MKYYAQITLTDTLVLMPVEANSLEQALALAKERLKSFNLFKKEIDVVDTHEVITGIYK